MAGHHILAPSAAERWLRCPVSVAACKGLPDTTSVYAAEGTKAHDAAQQLLTGSQPGCSREMLSYVKQYTDCIEAGADVEVRLDIALGRYRTSGTADAIVLSGTTLHVHDLKYGRGVEVFAEENPQLLLYGLGAMQKYSMVADDLVLHIHQPRLRHRDSWPVPAGYLEAFSARAAAAAGQAMEYVTRYGDDRSRIPVSLFQPSPEACRWCKYKAHCPGLKDAVVSAVAHDPSGALVDSYRKLDMVKGWCTAVASEMRAALEKGDVEGYKLVEVRKGRRIWSDEKEAGKKLVDILPPDAVFSTKLKSPSQIEKAVTLPEDIAAYIVREAPVLGIVESGDPRPPVSPASVIDMFD